ncbi:MAG: murein L,D-transpeptidase [Chitinophagaceae bacterium]
MLQPTFSRRWLFLIVPVLAGCGMAGGSEVQPDLAISPEELANKTTEHIRLALEGFASGQSPWHDSTELFDSELIAPYYSEGQYRTVWSSAGNWQPVADSFYKFIEQARYRGLFPEHYHFGQLSGIRSAMELDTLAKAARRDAVQWAKADILLTDAFFRVIHDLRLGRIPADSLTARKDSVLPANFYTQRLAAARNNHSLSLAFYGLEPRHPDYVALLQALPKFVDQMSDRRFTEVPSPKSGEGFKKALQTRLFEAGYLSHDSLAVDSITLAAAVKKFQEDQRITVDGKAGEGTVRVLNMTDDDRFARIAITLDKFKHLPDTLPGRYVWVNIAGYNMALHQGDSVALESKIICGKPNTRTPQLTSAISELITYPQWTVPTSIIVKEILPAVKKDPGYLAKKGFSLIDKEGNEVDPYTVEWSKYSKGIPYKVVQGSGDDNALGILKFNFPNKYAVYLHDTNQRYLFARDSRSLSHGCVRVQAWDKLAQNIIRYDHPLRKDGSVSPVEDSLNSWLKQKVKKHIAVRNRLPVYIRYLTCEARKGQILFHEDIYGEDKMLQARYYARP